MSYCSKYKWEVTPLELPVIKRNCPKCGKKQTYINTEKFRINANRNIIDIWMIYQCNHCKSIWNMPIYERVSVKKIPTVTYEKFLANNKDLVYHYAFNSNIHKKNQAEYFKKDINYAVNKIKLNNCQNQGQTIVIRCKYPLDIRVDRFLSEQLKISRTRIKRAIKQNGIFSPGDEDFIKAKIKDGMVIHIRSLLTKTV